MRKVIDSLFDQSSYIMKFQLLMFVVGFFLPFTINVFHHDVYVIMLSNILCLISLLMLKFLDVIILNDQGVSYFYNIVNLFDTVISFIYVFIYFWHRMLIQHSSIVPNKIIHVSDTEIVVWMCLNISILFYCVMKIMTYARVYEQFGTMGYLFKGLMKAILKLSLFTTVWVILFSIFYGLAGIKIFDSDFSSIEEFFAFVSQMFENIIGTNLANSTHQWTETVSKTFPGISNFLGTYSLFLWLLNLLFMLMVFLSFMTSFMNSVYEMLMFDPQVLHYTNRCEIICETNFIADFFKALFKRQEFAKVFILVANINE